MIFSRIIFSSVLIGMVAGSLLSCLQVIGVNPILFSAESYETPPPAEVLAPSQASEQSHDHDHSHDHDAGWAPGDGAERTFYTFVSNILASIGFAAMLLAIMSQFQLPKNRQISWLQGVVWGLAGFTALYLAPALGLPPEIPGIEAAPVAHRQIWWGFTVIGVSAGLGIIAFAPTRFKIIGLLFLILPYIVGAPQVAGPEFTHSDPAAVSALNDLHQQFIVASGITNLVFWIFMGLACAWVFNRWLQRSSMTTDYAGA